MIPYAAIRFLRLDEVDLVRASHDPLNNLWTGVELSVDQENGARDTQPYLDRNSALRPHGPAGQQPEDRQSIQSF